MTPAILPPSAGRAWIVQAWHLYRRQPGAFTILAVVYSVLSSLLGLILPLVSFVLFLAITPTLMFLVLHVCRLASRDQPLLSLKTIDSFKAYSRNDIRTFLKLGGLYILGCLVLIGLLLLLIDRSQIEALRQMTETINASTAPPPANDAVFALLYVPLVLMLIALLWTPLLMMFSFAAALAVWQGHSVRKSLFFSFFACWHNWRPFAIYTLVWLGLAMGAAIGLAIIALVLPPLAFKLIFQALYLLAFVISACSLYPIYTNIFTPPPAAPATEPATSFLDDQS